MLRLLIRYPEGITRRVYSRGHHTSTSTSARGITDAIIMGPRRASGSDITSRFIVPLNHILCSIGRRLRATFGLSRDKFASTLVPSFRREGDNA